MPVGFKKRPKMKMKKKNQKTKQQTTQLLEGMVRFQRDTFFLSAVLR